MAEDSSKGISEVTVANYDKLTAAVAASINSVLNKLVTLQVINANDKQLIKKQDNNQLQAECLLDRFILGRVESGEDEMFFTLLKVLSETGKCSDVVNKIYAELGKSPPPVEHSSGADDDETSFEMDPKTNKMIVGIVLPRVSAYWDTIAAFLEYPIPKTKEIDRHCRGDPKECCKMLLEDWFTSRNGVKPKRWDKLVEVLSEISDIAASTVQIKKLLREEGVIE